ncbi:Cysteamine dioxygenase [Bertholletia excelsa]
MPNIVQELYETCSEVFAEAKAGYVPPSDDIQRLRLVLDNIKPEDINVAPTMPYFNGAHEHAEAPTPVTYIHIYDCEKFSIGIFCLPPSGTIPLHNHPGMTVFSKVLFGSMHIKSYDWVTDTTSPDNDHMNNIRRSQEPHHQLAKVCVDADFTAPCETSILYPAAGGNMHCFTALTACAVLDVLGPPYSDAEGRDCTYFDDSSRVFPSELSAEEGREGNDYAWLKETKKPESFVLLGAMYDGPRISEN